MQLLIKFRIDTLLNRVWIRSRSSSRRATHESSVWRAILIYFREAIHITASSLVQVLELQNEKSNRNYSVQGNQWRLRPVFIVSAGAGTTINWSRNMIFFYQLFSKRSWPSLRFILVLWGYTCAIQPEVRYFRISPGSLFPDSCSRGTKALGIRALTSQNAKQW